jgi:hypothetical protein
MYQEPYLQPFIFFIALQNTRLESPVTDKHFSLLNPFVTEEESEVL